jgi:NAD(P)-dependent dehydrogenase (short-subunit alcohol dehydrogenase family)
LAKLTSQEWSDVIDTNLNSIFKCTKAAIGCMKDHGYGRIVKISSVVGQEGAFGQANYAASKVGVIGFNKSSAQG